MKLNPRDWNNTNCNLVIAPVIQYSVARDLPDDFPTAESLAGAADHKLFVSIAGNPHHVLRRHYTMRKSPLVTTCTPGLITFYSLKRTMETLSPGPYMLNSTLRIFFTLFKSLISVAVTLSTE